MKKSILIAVVMSSVLAYVSSCYNNKEDILSLPKVSFRGEVVPIVTSGACGCHNTGITADAVQFSHADTIFYDAILARVTVLDSMAKYTGKHPGQGVVEFSANEKIIIKNWIAQGAVDDAAGACTAVGSPRYTTDIVSIYTTTCKGPSCHGGLGPVLDYARLTLPANVAKLTSMSNSRGTIGHPNPPGPVNISACTAEVIKTWLALGQPQ